MSDVNNDVVTSQSTTNTIITDKFGVREIFKTKQGAISWYLNDNANNSDLTIHELDGKIAKRVDRNFKYFSAPVGEGGLASGGSRPTLRLDIRASGERNGDQKYNYRNGAISKGYLWNDKDIGDSEFTIIARRRGIHGDHYVDFNIRGGDHHDDSTADCSCFQILYPTQVIKAGTTQSMFAKELDHSVFDHYTSKCNVTTKGWPVNTWMAFKAVTYVSNASKKEVTNRLYYDPDPIDFTKNPPTLKNNYVLLSEYIDRPGDTGHYDVPVTWKGCTWSIRIDNADFVDFACVSLRSIEPTLNPTTDGGGTDDGGGGGDTGISTIPILSQPQSNLYYDKGGSMIKKPYVWVIFWGDDWNTRTTPFSKDDIMSKLSTLFDTTYFDSLFQYRFLKRPILLGSSVCTDVSLPSLFRYQDMTDIVQTEMQKLPAGIARIKGNLGITAYDVLFIICPPSGMLNNPAEGLPSYASHSFDDYNSWAYTTYQANLNTQTFIMTYELVNMMTNNNPDDDEAIIVNPDASESVDPAIQEICDICFSSSPIIISGVNVAKYWSNQDNTCIAPYTGYPTFISCHIGAKWDPVQQACIVTDTTNVGGGIDDSGGVPIPTTGGGVDTTTPVYVPSILANPKGNEVLDKGGTIPTQLTVYIIFWGSAWNSGIPASNKTAITADMTNLFKTYYFDHIYQYRRIKRPILGGIVTNTTYAPVDNYTATNVTALIDNCKSTGLIPTSVDATKTLFIIMNLDPNNPVGGVNIDRDHFKDTYVWGYINYHTSVSFWDQDLTNLIINTATDFDPLTGFVLKSNDNFPGHTEGVDELTEICSTTATINGVIVRRYWSNQDNACIAKNTAPTWISCPQGSTWHPDIQECVKDVVAGDGGGDTGGGGDVDPGTDGSGGPVQGPAEGGSDTPSIVEGKHVLPSILSNPATRYFSDLGGPIETPMRVIFIFWGSEWNATNPLGLSKDMIMAHMMKVFSSNYFDGLYQYRKIKRPILLGSVVNTTVPVVSNWRHSDVVNVVNDSVSKGLVPQNEIGQTNNIVHFVIGPSGRYFYAPPDFSNSFAASGHGWNEIVPGTVAPYHILGWAVKAPNNYVLIDQTEWITHALIGILTDPKPKTGIILSNTGVTSNVSMSLALPSYSIVYPTSDPDLPTPKTSEVLYGGGPQNQGPMEFYFIFCGSAWNSTYSSLRTNYTNDIKALFKSPYFDYLIEYGIKRPILKSIVTAPSNPVPNLFTVSSVFSTIIDLVNADIIPFYNDEPVKQNRTAYYLLPTPNIRGSSDGFGGWHTCSTNDDKSFNIIFGINLTGGPSGSTYDIQTTSMTHEIIEILSDNIPTSGWTLKHNGKFSAIPDPLQFELGDVCDYNTSGQFLSTRGGDVVGVRCEKYWSDQAGKCVAPTSKPTFMICPSGYKWNNTTQQCVSTKGVDDGNLGDNGTVSALPSGGPNDPLFTTKLSNNVQYMGGPQQQGPLKFTICIYGVSFKDGNEYGDLRLKIISGLDTLFDSAYFDYMIQYGYTKRPVLKDIVFFDTLSTINTGYTASDLTTFFEAQITAKKITGNSATDKTNAHLLITPFGMPADGDAQGLHFGVSKDSGAYYHIFGSVEAGDDFLTTMDPIAYQILAMISDNIPILGYRIDPSGALSTQVSSLGPEIIDVCADQPGGLVSGLSVPPYWSDQDNACILPSTKNPPWLSCPIGLHWDATAQQCVSVVSGGGLGSGGGAGGEALPIFAAQKANYVAYGGGPQLNPLEFYVIFAGASYLTGGANAVLYTKIKTDLLTLFRSTYFDALYQYGLAKRPTLKGIVINNTITIANNYTVDNITALIDDSIAHLLVPTNSANKKNIAYLIITEPGLVNVGGSDGFHYSISRSSNAWHDIIGVVSPSSVSYPITSSSYSYELVSIVSDNLPTNGFTILPSSPLGPKVTLYGPEITDVVSDQPLGTVSAITVSPYWSDMDAAATISETAPIWISCPQGSTWDSQRQACIIATTTVIDDGPDPTGPPVGGPELTDVCIMRKDGKGFVSDDDDKVSVVGYWSDQDGKCITSTSSPKWITCPTGSTWDPKIQECVLDSDPTGGDTGGGEGSGGGGLNDDSGTGDQTNPAPLMAVSRDWTFRMDVGVNSDDSCTAGNPMEKKDPKVFYEVSIDTNTKAFEDMGYNYGNGITEIGVYVNTVDSILYGKVIKRVEISAIKRMLDENDDTCSGYLYCAIVRFPDRQIIKWINYGTNVQAIDINYQSLVFDNLENDEPLGVNDAVVIMYADDSASPERCLRIKRTSKNMIDGPNSFMVVRDANGYSVNEDLDLSIKLYE